MAILEQMEDSAAQASIPNRGAEKCVCTLRNRQIPVGILTRNSLKSVKKGMEKFEKVGMFVDFALAYALLNFIGSLAASRFLHKTRPTAGRAIDET